MKPTAVRQKIQEQGFVPDPVFDGDTVTFFDSEELATADAQRAADGFVDTPEGRADVWKVDLVGIEYEHHAFITDARSVNVRGGVGPGRAELVKTF